MDPQEHPWVTAIDWLRGLPKLCNDLEEKSKRQEKTIADLNRQITETNIDRHKAVIALVRAGFTRCPGEAGWKPPLGPRPDFEVLAHEQIDASMLPIKEGDTWRTRNGDLIGPMDPFRNSLSGPFDGFTGISFRTGMATQYKSDGSWYWESARGRKPHMDLIKREGQAETQQNVSPSQIPPGERRVSRYENGKLVWYSVEQEKPTANDLAEAMNAGWPRPLDKMVDAIELRFIAALKRCGLVRE